MYVASFFFQSTAVMLTFLGPLGGCKERLKILSACFLATARSSISWPVLREEDTPWLMTTMLPPAPWTPPFCEEAYFSGQP